jgi:hypothetical protein
MISDYDYEELAITRRQLAHAENALVSLHEEVFAKNPRNYAVFSESYIDMILQLRAEIDAFLHIAPAPPETQPSGDNGPTDSQPVGQHALAGLVGVARTPEPTPSTSGTAPA